MIFGLVTGQGALQGIRNPIVELFMDNDVLKLRLLIGETAQIWTWVQSVDELATTACSTGFTTTIANLIGLPDIPITTWLSIELKKSDITTMFQI